MLWRRKLPLATAQQFIGHTSQSLDSESIILFCLKEACNNKNMFVRWNTLKRNLFFKIETRFICHFEKINCPAFIIWHDASVTSSFSIFSPEAESYPTQFQCLRFNFCKNIHIKGITSMRHHSQQTVRNGLWYCLSSSCLFPDAWYVRTWKMIVSKVTVQCPERQRVENFGVLRSDAVYLGARFFMFLPNVAKHPSSDSVVSHTRRADYR